MSAPPGQALGRPAAHDLVLAAPPVRKAQPPLQPSLRPRCPLSRPSAQDRAVHRPQFLSLPPDPFLRAVPSFPKPLGQKPQLSPGLSLASIYSDSSGDTQPSRAHAAHLAPDSLEEFLPGFLSAPLDSL